MQSLRLCSRLFVCLLLMAPFLVFFPWFRGTLDSSHFQFNGWSLTLTDPFSALSIMTSSLSIEMSLLTSSLIVLTFYLLIRPKVFCAWVCPMSLLFDTFRGEVKKHRNLKLGKSTRWTIFFGLLVLGAVSSSPLWLSISPISWPVRIAQGLSPTFILLVCSLVVLEWINKDYFFCKHICPVGSFYSLFNKWGTVKITIDASCNGCLECSKNCLASEGLLQTTVKAGRLDQDLDFIHPDCSLCGYCIQSCPSNAIQYTSAFSKLAQKSLYHEQRTAQSKRMVQ